MISSFLSALGQVWPSDIRTGNIQIRFLTKSLKKVGDAPSPIHYNREQPNKCLPVALSRRRQSPFSIKSYNQVHDDE